MFFQDRWKMQFDENSFEEWGKWECCTSFSGEKYSFEEQIWKVHPIVLTNSSFMIFLFFFLFLCPNLSDCHNYIYSMFDTERKLRRVQEALRVYNNCNTYCEKDATSKKSIEVKHNCYCIVDSIQNNVRRDVWSWSRSWILV